eukprot:TRINITY_DN34587_c0_g1_i4.p1 TRINITY_DN34587_c0_g1~~TRINITY_DN34587_c0_g1_i4.p1  ORF type:complete len:209 (+),score=2.86 TRINITY_DN34587_c0_g1_i4:96-629(+)
MVQARRTGSMGMPGSMSMPGLTIPNPSPINLPPAPPSAPPYSYTPSPTPIMGYPSAPTLPIQISSPQPQVSLPVTTPGNYEVPRSAPPALSTHRGLIPPSDSVDSISTPDDGGLTTTVSAPLVSSVMNGDITLRSRASSLNSHSSSFHSTPFPPFASTSPIAPLTSVSTSISPSTPV